MPSSGPSLIQAVLIENKHNTILIPIDSHTISGPFKLLQIYPEGHSWFIKTIGLHEKCKLLFAVYISTWNYRMNISTTFSQLIFSNLFSALPKTCFHVQLHFYYFSILSKVAIFYFVCMSVSKLGTGSSTLEYLQSLTVNRTTPRQWIPHHLAIYISTLYTTFKRWFYFIQNKLPICSVPKCGIDCHWYDLSF